MSECAENPAPVKAKASKSFKVSPDLTRWSIHDQESNQDYAKYQRDEIDEEGESLSSERSDFISRDKISRAISGMVPDFYEVQAEHSPEGDMPLPDGFANTFTFWRILGVAIFLGLTMGTVGECFVNIVDEVPRLWVGTQQFSNYTDFYPFQGKLYWIAIPTVGGFVVGFLRLLVGYPEKIKSIFTEMNTCHVEYIWGRYTLWLSLISLSCGASLGPEAGLGNVGGSIAMFLTEKVGWIKALPMADRKLLVLSGMAAALGGLFSSPMLSVLMVFELGKPVKPFMETIVVLGVTAVVASAVAYSLIGVTWQEYSSTTLWKLSAQWEYNQWNLWDGCVVGIFAGFFTGVFILMLGITRQLFSRLRQRLSWSPFLLNVVPCVLGGVCIGVTNYCLPMTVGNGNQVIGSLIKAGLKQQLPQWLYIQSGFARMALLAISMNCGFIGGLGYPIITMGFIAATVSILKFPSIPPALFLSCWMAAAPLGLIPMPYTFTVLSCLTFQLNAYQSAVVFVSALSSYLIMSGSGIISTLQKGSLEREAKGKADRLALELAQTKALDPVPSPHPPLPSDLSSIEIHSAKSPL